MTVAVHKVAGGWLFLSVACSEPLTGELGVIYDEADATVDAAVMPSADGAAGSKADAETATDAALLVSDSCVQLPDMGGKLVAFAPPEFTWSSLDADSMCLEAHREEAGSFVYGFTDQRPMLVAGRTYSFSWSVSSLLNKLKLFGGNTRCPSEVVVDVPLPNAIAMMSPFNLATPIPGCQLFTSPVTAQFLMPAETMGARLALSAHTYVICEGACPPPP